VVAFRINAEGDCEGNIKRYRNSAMAQRRLGTVLPHSEKGL
jgi:hypothetical protein